MLEIGVWLVLALVPGARCRIRIMSLPEVRVSVVLGLGLFGTPFPGDFLFPSAPSSGVVCVRPCSLEWSSTHAENLPGPSMAGYGLPLHCASSLTGLSGCLYPFLSTSSASSQSLNSLKTNRVCAKLREFFHKSWPQGCLSKSTGMTQ